MYFALPSLYVKQGDLRYCNSVCTILGVSDWLYMYLTEEKKLGKYCIGMLAFLLSRNQHAFWVRVLEKDWMICYGLDGEEENDKNIFR